MSDFWDTKIGKGKATYGDVASTGADFVGDQLGKGKKHSKAMQASSGAMKGFSAGMATGNPLAAGIGAALGGISGALGAAAERKRMLREADSKFNAADMRASQQASEQKQKAISGLRAAFAQTLLSKGPQVGY